jgi:hypothetical protein
MEINMTALGATYVRRRTIILDRGIHISDLDKFMWIKTKQNYDNYVERLENWKDISEKEEWADKARLIILILMKWETPIPNIMLEFLNTFVIKGTHIYFGYKDKVYVISKQLIINVFGVCAKGYVKDPKGQVNNIITL